MFRGTSSTTRRTKKSEEKKTESSITHGIIGVSDMEVPCFDISKSKQRDVNDAHYKQLAEYAKNYDEDEAWATMDILVRKYPQMAMNCISNNYARMERNIRDVTSTLKGE